MSVRTERDVAVFLNVRLPSRRCPGKMLRPFAGSTLVDIGLQKIAALGWPQTYFGAHEPELLERARPYPGIRVHRRSAESARSDSDPRLIFEILDVIESDFVMWINPCVPLLSVDTLREALAEFLKSGWMSLTSVRELPGWFYTADGRPLNDTRGGIDTMLSAPILQVAHAFHIYDRRRMIERGRPWPNGPDDPHLFVIPEAEAHDIDTEAEFDIAEYFYRRRHHG